MQPQEHRLSQEVLEFLIAHQDWFMLDITPPPASGAALADDELDTILSSDEEANGGSWRLVGNPQPTRIARRRTMTEKHGSKSSIVREVIIGRLTLNFAAHGALTEGITSDELAPVTEVPGSPAQSAGGSIRRSRTLPNRRGTVDGRSAEGDVPPATTNSPTTNSPAQHSPVQHLPAQNSPAQQVSTPEEPHRARVLRKQKRSSIQSQRHSHV